MRLAVSIVIFRPDLAVLEQTLRTLAHACSMAREDLPIEALRLLLTDHSPRQALTPQAMHHWTFLAAAGIRLEYRHDPANPGFGAGHNAAFRHFFGDSQDQGHPARFPPAGERDAWRANCGEARFDANEYFLAANPDIEFQPDSIVAGLRFLDNHPATGVIVPALLEADGMRPACFRPPDALTLALRAAGVEARRSARIARYECRDWDATQTVMNPPLMSGCCMLFRSAAYARLGGFDPGYFLYFEDFDLARRAGRLGLSAYCPAMQLRHAGGRAGKKGWRHILWFLRSALRYHCREPRA